MNRHNMLMIHSAIEMMGGMSKIVDRFDRKDPEDKPCLQCGKPKSHNNSFCSPECCKKYRSIRHNGVCIFCGGEGVVDSGGVTPWGQFIEVPCQCRIK